MLVLRDGVIQTLVYWCTVNKFVIRQKESCTFVTFNWISCIHAVKYANRHQIHHQLFFCGPALARLASLLPFGRGVQYVPPLVPTADSGGGGARFTWTAPGTWGATRRLDSSTVFLSSSKDYVSGGRPLGVVSLSYQTLGVLRTSVTFNWNFHRSTK